MKKTLLALLVITIGLVPAVSENKTALVIGNGAYRHFQPLVRPRPEAIDMKNTLESLGFEVVLVLDGTYDRMYDAISTFERKLAQRGGIAFFHYGGHGVQVAGENYLLPVDKSIPDELRVRSRAVSANEIVASMRASGTRSNIIVLDACRNNPLPAATRSANTRGLARLDAPINSIVVYSAEAGKTAEDGVFTPTLVEYLKIPGLDIGGVMMRVRRAVYEKTGGKQVPGEYSQLFEPVYLAGPPSGETGSEGTKARSSSGPSSAAEKKPVIGDNHAGGIVFYLDGEGGGLVAAPSDQGTSYTWGPVERKVGMTYANAGTGGANTKNIVQALGSKAKAAKICDDLVLNGYDDWFLPSKDELNLIYENLYKKGLGDFKRFSYWSSSEYDSGHAWGQSFYSGDQNYYVKTYNNRIRAVRAF